MEIILARINSPDYRPGRFAKMEEFAAIWQEQVLVGKKPSTIRAAKSHINMHIVPHFGKHGLDEIGVEAQQLFVTRLARANLSRKTVMNVVSTLSSILETAKAWGYVCQSVNYKCLSFPTEEVQPEARFFTLDEVGKIIAAAREPYKTMFLLLAMTGMRAGEVLGLQWQDVDCRCLRSLRLDCGSIFRVKMARVICCFPIATGVRFQRTNCVKNSFTHYSKSWAFHAEGSIPCVTVRPVPCSPTGQPRRWYRGNCGIAMQESRWEFTAMWLEISSDKLWRVAPHVLQNMQRASQLLASRILLAKRKLSVVE